MCDGGGKHWSPPGALASPTNQHWPLPNLFSSSSTFPPFQHSSSSFLRFLSSLWVTFTTLLFSSIRPLTNSTAPLSTFLFSLDVSLLYPRLPRKDNFYSWAMKHVGIVGAQCNVMHCNCRIKDDALLISLPRLANSFLCDCGTAPKRDESAQWIAQDRLLFLDSAIWLRQHNVRQDLILSNPCLAVSVDSPHRGTADTSEMRRNSSPLIISLSQRPRKHPLSRSLSMNKKMCLDSMFF